jgi:anti-sigma regulatory factor (Ser/Thr protein kinase)/RimJ/RimL family protein N-acetyltransferase
MQTEAKIKVKSKVELIEPIVDFCYRWGINSDLSEKEASEFALALNELITDIILFAYPEEEGEFNIEFANFRDYIKVIVSELGEPFDPNRHQYSLEKVLKEENFEGAGFKLIHNLVDDFIFLNKGKNGKEYRIIKNIKHKHITEIFKEEEIKKEEEISENVQYCINVVNEDDAEDISKLIYRVYGYTYPKEEMYFPDKVKLALKQGKKFGVIVRTNTGEAVGYFAVIMSTDSKIGEVGEAVVSPKHRGKGLMKSMLKALIDLAKSKGLLGLFGEAVTVHTISQKVNAKFGFKSTALLVGMFPSDIKYKNIAENYPQRISVVIDFLPFYKDDEKKVYLPKEYSKILKEIYQNLGYKVVNLKTKANKLKNLSTIDINISYKFGNAVLIVREYGKDLEIQIEQKLKDLENKGIKAIFIDLPLDDQNTKNIVPTIKKYGFVFAGLMPLFHKERDYLRMQKILTEIKPELIQVYSDTAKKIKSKVFRELKWIMKSKKTQ